MKNMYVIWFIFNLNWPQRRNEYESALFQLLMLFLQQLIVLFIFLENFSMKKLLLASLAVAAMAVSGVAAAAQVTSTFTVSVTLAATCVANNSGSVTLNFGTYTAITGGAATTAPTGNLTFNCTRGLAAPVVSFDGVTTNPTYGVLAGLNYSVTAAAPTFVAGAAATATLAGTGGPDVYTVALTGAMPAGQAGACNGATATACNTATTVTRTMTLTY